MAFKKRHRDSNDRGSSIKPLAFANEFASNTTVSKLIEERSVKVKFPGEETPAKKWRLTNDEDLLMVLEVLKLISCAERKNIYCYLKAIIVEQGPEAACKELVKLRGVGDKLATMTIRDILIKEVLDKRLDLEQINRKGWDCKFAFPVDTWVRKLAKKLDCGSSDDDEAIKAFLIAQCKGYGINPLLFAAGLWYLASHALDILIDSFCNSVGSGSSYRSS